jgi:hypothetical protein
MICQFCILTDHKDHMFESAQPILRGRVTKCMIEKALNNNNQWIRRVDRER